MQVTVSVGRGDRDGTRPCVVRVSGRVEYTFRVCGEGLTLRRLLREAERASGLTVERGIAEEVGSAWSEPAPTLGVTTVAAVDVGDASKYQGKGDMG